MGRKADTEYSLLTRHNKANRMRQLKPINLVTVTSSYGLKPVSFPFRSLRLRPSLGRWFRKAICGSCGSRAFARHAFPARSPRQAWWVTLRVSELGDHHPPWETETQVFQWGHHPTRSRLETQTIVRGAEYLNEPSSYHSSSHP